MDEEIFFAGVVGQAQAIRDGRLGSRELVEATLERVRRYDGRLNAFTNVLADAALAEADARDAAPAEDRGPLHGVPMAVKEEVDVAGAVTTYGGRANVTPAIADSEIVRRLRGAGAVIVGKTNMSEFGSWPLAESVAHGNTRNPWDTDKASGGSSGGTAAAVATGMVAAGIGGDGGGSIRIPAAWCGLIGLKPQRGRVSSAPHPHLWWGLGTAGPLSRTVLDSALVYDVIRGPMPGDLFRAGEPRMPFVEAASTKPGRLRIGWSTKAVVRGVRPDAEHVRAVEHVAAALERLGHEVREIDPHYPDPTVAFVPQFFAGVRTCADLVEHRERLERRTLETTRLGAWVRPPVLRWSLRQGERVAAKANRVFDRSSGGADLLLTPTTPHRPPDTGVIDGRGTVRSMWTSTPVISYAALWNVTGNPAASVPAGFAHDGMPLAVQLVGRTDDEPTVLQVAAQLERELPWADRRPAL